MKVDPVNANALIQMIWRSHEDLGPQAEGLRNLKEGAMFERAYLEQRNSFSAIANALGVVVCNPLEAPTSVVLEDVAIMEGLLAVLEVVTATEGGEDIGTEDFTTLKKTFGMLKTSIDILDLPDVMRDGESLNWFRFYTDNRHDVQNMVDGLTGLVS